MPPNPERRGVKALESQVSIPSSDDNDWRAPSRTTSDMLSMAVRFVRDMWTSLTGNALDAFHDKGRKGRAFRGIVGTVFVGSGCVLVWLFQWCRTNLHVHFWLEDLPLVGIFCAMLAIGILFGVLAQMRFVHLLRRRETRISLEMNAAGRKWKDRDCSIRPGATKYLLYFSLLPAAVSAWMGFMTLKLGPAVAGEIAGQNCGASGSSKQIADVERRLTDFYNQCQHGADAPGRDHPITDCPLFADAFPPPSPMVGYIKASEQDFDCAGFCRAGARPFFDRSSGDGKERCSVAISRRLLLVSRAVGGLCITLSLGTAFIAFSLATLNDL